MLCKVRETPAVPAITFAGIYAQMSVKRPERYIREEGAWRVMYKPLAPARFVALYFAVYYGTLAFARSHT